MARRSLLACSAACGLQAKVWGQLDIRVGLLGAVPAADGLHVGMEASVAARGGVLQSSREKGRGLCPRRAQTRRGGGGPPAGEWLGRTVTGRVPDDQSGEVKKRCLSAARASGKGGAGERARTPFTGNFITRNLSTQNGRPAGRPRPPRTHHPTDLPHVPVRESPRVVHGSRRGQAPAPGLSLCFSP